RHGDPARQRGRRRRHRRAHQRRRRYRAVVSPAAGLPDRWLADWQRSRRMPFYTRANAGEVLPDPASPLGWTLVFEKGLLPGWLRGLVEFGIYREGELPMERPPVA